PEALAIMSAPAAGAALGYQIGDKPEEKRRNAILGASLASGGALGLKAIQVLARSNPGLLNALRDMLKAKELSPKEAA
ncbi:hypothetical protein, partial [Psychrobacter sanguinis]|uniref:hypothetical protein n=1 Tax=Psychrobacter sanguinis TaxID=861445 RepID=UPI00195C73C2